MKIVVWDFDGTLAFRDRRWSGAFLDLLQEFQPHLSVTQAEVSAALQTGFPWHTPDVSHEHICDADAWWEWMKPAFKRAFVETGVAPSRAEELAGRVRETFCATASWALYPDSIETLELLAAHGWTHVLLSNHVPELPKIVAGLGLSRFFHRIVNSAETGFEKPHPKAYQLAVKGLDPVSEVWMIGDSISADFEGPRREGWKAILVRQRGMAQPSCESLQEAAAHVATSTRGPSIWMDSGRSPI